MFKFFDYLYYGIFKQYDGKNSSPEFAASCAVAGLQSFNILSLVLIYDIVMRWYKADIKLLVVILIIVLIILNYIRYIQIDRFNHEKIKAKWDMKTPRSKVVTRSLLVAYIVLSTVLVIGLAIFHARLMKEYNYYL